MAGSHSLDHLGEQVVARSVLRVSEVRLAISREGIASLRVLGDAPGLHVAVNVGLGPQLELATHRDLAAGLGGSQRDEVSAEQGAGGGGDETIHGGLRRDSAGGLLGLGNCLSSHICSPKELRANRLEIMINQPELTNRTLFQTHDPLLP